ncbi:MAG: hypothetical protein AAGN82_25370, partial [Myxococcota bacterium]
KRATPHDSAAAPPDPEPTPPGDSPDRADPSRKSTLEIVRTSIIEGRKSTTLVELAAIADDLGASDVTRRLWMVGGGSVALAIGLAVVVLLSVPTWAAVTLIGFPSVLLVSAAATAALKATVTRLGSRGRTDVPGGVVWYLVALGCVIVGVSAAATWGNVTLARAVARDVLRRPSLPEPPAPEPTPTAAPADRKLELGGRAKRVRPGLLYLPSTFASPTGRFDLLIHFHGSPPLVQQSVEAAGLNAVVLTVNLGLGGEPYKERLARNDAFDRLIERVTKHLRKRGLENAALGRVAVSAWSAGYGAVFMLLRDANRDQPLDALLLLDTPHGSFVTERQVHPPSIAPFVAYGRRAIDEEQLMVITHSDIRTDEYASTTETTDAILEALGVPREEGGAPVSVPDLKVAHRAFPSGEKRWLEPSSVARRGDFIVRGFTGRDESAHIAHLAQMSQWALPQLVARWQARGAP